MPCVSKRHYSGYEFFGFYRKDVLQHLTVPENYVHESAVLKSISDIIKRNSGVKTSELVSKQAQMHRNEKIHAVINYASYNDVKSYLNYLLDNHIELVIECVEEDDDLKKQLLKKIGKLPYVDLGVKESAEILLNRSKLSQRGFNALRTILGKENVNLATYDHIRSYLNGLDIGTLSNATCCPIDCMASTQKVTNLIESVVQNKFWYDKMTFFDPEIQKVLFEVLKAENHLYKNLDYSKKTIFLRLTGDNFRAACKMPTEQVSISVMNIKDMLHSPYGQFILSIWRAAESRISIEIHSKDHFENLENLVMNGIEMEVDGEQTFFNVLVFLCADLAFLKEVLGKCTSTSMYGCLHCKKNIKDWSGAPYQSPETCISEMCAMGNEGVEILGENPDHSTPAFTKFQQSHFGQYAPPLIKCVSMKLVLPCGLHLVLAHHRYLWCFAAEIIERRGQSGKIASSLREIGCHFLALQHESYLKSKNKYYDGSPTLKMVGRDCQIIEQNVDKLFQSFLLPEECIADRSFEGLRHAINLYRLFYDLAQDVRCLTYNKERANSFQSRAEIYFATFKLYAKGSSVSRKPYLHIIRDHIGSMMKFWGELTGWVL